METYEAILARRSIRKFCDREIPAEVMEKILTAAIKAPSSKNMQPWKFIVVQNDNKQAMLDAMRSGLKNAEKQEGLLPNTPKLLAAAEHSAEIMEQAPVTVFVFNVLGSPINKDKGVADQLIDMLNIQSIAAAVENMLLAATSLGIGSLWICDVFFAHEELCQWLNEKNQLVAAVSFGYPDEKPNPRPRKEFNAVVEWR